MGRLLQSPEVNGHSPWRGCRAVGTQLMKQLEEWHKPQFKFYHFPFLDWKMRPGDMEKPQSHNLPTSCSHILMFILA